MLFVAFVPPTFGYVLPLLHFSGRVPRVPLTLSQSKAGDLLPTVLAKDQEFAMLDVFGKVLLKPILLRFFHRIFHKFRFLGSPCSKNLKRRRWREYYHSFTVQ